MKHSKKLLMMLMAFALCAVFAVCGSAAGKAEDMTSDQTNDIVKTAHNRMCNSKKIKSFKPHRLKHNQK